VSGNRRDPIASSGIFPGLWHMNVRQLGRSELGQSRRFDDVSATSALSLIADLRGGLTSKIHAVVDTNGLPVHLALTPGEAHDNRLCSVLLSALLPQTMLLADRGYDADWIRELARRCPRD
jgi:hypothetical protein